MRAGILSLTECATRVTIALQWIHRGVSSLVVDDIYTQWINIAEVYKPG